MSIDSAIISQAVATHANGDIISDLQARVIAGAYHEGMPSRFYALTSTGTIDNRDGWLGCELEHAERIARRHGEADAIDALRAYIADRGTRGPVKGWADLHW